MGRTNQGNDAVPVSVLNIHIGLPKTGTTSLQVFCARQRSWLAAQGLYYPATMRAPMPTSSQHRYINAAMRAQFADGGHGGDHALAMLAQEISRQNLRNALISEEQFSYDSARSAPFLARLRAQFNVRILVFLRQQDQWAESMYAQAVRGGYRHDFAAFLAAQATRERLHAADFLAIWAASFGAENLRVGLYRGGQNCAQALALLGLPAFDGPPPERFNPSLPGEAIMFMRGLRRVPPDLYPRFNTLFAGVLAGLCDPAPFTGFTPAARLDFAARHAGANRRAAALWPVLQGLNATDLRDDPLTPAMPPARRLALLRALVRETGCKPPGIGPTSGINAQISAYESMLAQACAAQSQAA
ncbi:MAG: hypothetical protein WDA25_05100 [Paracoccaceae bacterium]